MKKLTSIVGAALLSVVGCGGGGSSGPVVTYTITAGTQELKGIPFPSDTLRDASGHVAIQTLEFGNGSPNFADILDDLNNEQDGFGATSGAFFPVGRYVSGAVGDAAVDPKTGSVDESTLAGNVHLLPLSCPDGSVTASTPELPVITHLRATDKPQQIYVRAEQGIVLHEQCTYAYVITSGVKTDKGALGPSADMAALLSDKAPKDSRLTAAYGVFSPLRTRLAAGSITTADVAGATVFTVHSLTPDYLNARTMLTATPAPTAAVSYIFARSKQAGDTDTLDALFGVPAMELPGDDNACATPPTSTDVNGCQAHGNIDYVINGTFQTIDFIGGTTKNPMGIDATEAGQIKHDSSGNPVNKGTILIPYSIVIPAASTGVDLTNLRVAVVQHGLGADRTSMLTVANTLAGKGIASILIDLPFHGTRRADAVDTAYNLTAQAGMDGFGESMTYAAFGFFDTKGNDAIGLPIANPRAIRAGFFQAVNDIEQAFRLIEGGDLSAIGAADARLAGLKFNTTHEVYVGESFGSMIGTIVSAFQPGLEASVLDVGGGGTVIPLLVNSATFGPLFTTVLDGAVGAQPTSDPLDTDWSYNLAQWLLEEGDSLAYSPYVVQQQSWPGDHPCHVLQISAYLDELVPNPANLALARGIGLQPLTLSDGTAPDLTGWPEAMTATGQLMGNLPNGLTGAFIQFRPATHVLMTERTGYHQYDLSQPFPFPKLSTPVPVTNPIDRVNAIVGDFIDAASQGMTPTVK